MSVLQHKTHSAQAQRAILAQNQVSPSALSRSSAVIFELVHAALYEAIHQNTVIMNQAIAAHPRKQTLHKKKRAMRRTWDQTVNSALKAEQTDPTVLKDFETTQVHV